MEKADGSFTYTAVDAMVPNVAASAGPSFFPPVRSISKIKTQFRSTGPVSLLVAVNRSTSLISGIPSGSAQLARRRNCRRGYTRKQVLDRATSRRVLVNHHRTG